MTHREIEVRTRKWPDSPHWEYRALWLGADAVGQWVGVTSGTWMSRPGAGMHATADHVVLVPHDGWWLGTFYDNDPARPFDTYVDITTPASWEGDEMHCVDLDLDVVRDIDASVWVDDEDEFAEHQVALGYPAEIIEAARSSCTQVLELVGSDAAPFARATAAAWIARLRKLGDR